jgi:hypothetical protein
VLRARVSRIEGRKTFMTCSLYAQGVETARGEVLGIRLDETPQV